MKVLLVTEPGVNGVFQFVDSLGRFLSGEGVGVHLAYSDVRGCLALGRFVEFIEGRGGRTMNLCTGNAPQIADVSALWRLRRFVGEVKPDVIHCHSSKAGALGRLLRFLGCAVPVVYQPHAYVGLSGAADLQTRVYNGIERVLGRIGSTINVSDAERSFARKTLRIPPDRLHLIPNGVAPAAFYPATREAKRALRINAGLPVDAVILGTMGRLSVQKDPVTMYRAFAQVKMRVPKMVILHVGNGELESEVAAVIRDFGLADRVMRIARTERPLEFYQMLDGFILTSLYEGFSLAALEALAVNLPVILSDAPGNADVLRLKLSHAWCAAPGDADGFATAMDRWAAALDSGIEPNHRETVDEEVNGTRQLGRQMALYRRLIEDRVTAVELPRGLGGAEIGDGRL